ncbi:hypothetical protein HQ533_05970 [Candidatus Woesearchaeota archaeon]|nr:hypothetical protein [Candidatus Woesearchaeota archaeon]
MAKKKELHEVTSLDDYMADYYGDLDEAFKHYDAHTDEKVQKNLRVNIFLPAQQEMYNTIADELSNQFGDDQASIHGKKKELQGIAVKGMLKFFDKAGYKGLDEKVKEMEEEDKFRYLSNLYDQIELKHRGEEDFKNGLYSIRSLIEGHAKNKKATVLDLKDKLGSQMVQHAHRIQGNYTAKRAVEKLGKYEEKPELIGDYLKDKLKDRGVEISDKTQYSMHDYKTLISLREQMIKGKEFDDRFAVKYIEKKKK